MPFDPQPILKGDLIELRPLRAGDFDALYAVASDPLIWEQHPASNRYESKMFHAFFDDAMASGGALLAIDAKTQKVIGSSRYFGYDEATSEVEIGWTFLARSCWGGVYNGQMKDLMLRHAFQFVDSVVLLVGPQNLRSQRAVEKIGGVRVESRRDADGRERYVYQVRRLVMDNEGRKQIALDFLRNAKVGDRAGIERHVAPGARHHNAYFPAGMPALIEAMIENKGSADRTFDIKHVIGDGDYVAVHSHVGQEPGDLGVAVVHLFRFEGDRIAELWDVGQLVLADSPNSDGMF